MPTEKDLDRALHAALQDSDPFRAWFLRQLVRAGAHKVLVSCRSKHPWGKVRLILPNPDTGALEAVDREGETDVLAVFEDPQGHRLGVHIENKLQSGSFTDSQPELYAARAEQWVADERHGAYHSWETVLLAPSAFIERNAAQARKFSARITHEQVAQFVPAFGASAA